MFTIDARNMRRQFEKEQMPSDPISFRAAIAIISLCLNNK